MNHFVIIIFLFTIKINILTMNRKISVILSKLVNKWFLSTTYRFTQSFVTDLNGVCMSEEINSLTKKGRSVNRAYVDVDSAVILDVGISSTVE